MNHVELAQTLSWRENALFEEREKNVSVKPNEQCRAYSDIVMARKRTFRGTRKEPFNKLMSMKNKQKTNSFAGYKYLLFVPLIISLLTMNCTAMRANVQKKVVKTTKVTKKTGTNDKVYVVVEQMPSFPGGDSALLKYLFENVKYPMSALKAQKQGRVMVCFTVEKDGTITNVKVARSVTPSLDAEAVRAIKSMPKWSPGKQGGEFVRVKYNVPVTFKLK